MNLTTVEAIARELGTREKGEIPGEFRISPAVVSTYDAPDIRIDFAALANMHSYELRSLTITSADGVRLGIDGTVDGRLRLLGANLPLQESIVRILERTARPKMRIGGVLSALPWLVPVAAVVILFVTILRAESLTIQLIAWLALAIAVLSATTASRAIAARFRESWPSSIVNPVRWRDVLRGRATAIVAVTSALIGAIATMATVFGPQLFSEIGH